MGEEGVRMAGGTESDVGSVCHCIILDVLWEETTFLKEDPKTKLEKSKKQVLAMIKGGIPPWMTSLQRK